MSDSMVLATTRVRELKGLFFNIVAVANNYSRILDVNLVFVTDKVKRVLF